MMKRRPPEVKREARDDAARGAARHAGAGAAPDDPRGAARRDPPPGSRAARGGATHPAARAAEPAAPKPAADRVERAAHTAAARAARGARDPEPSLGRRLAQIGVLGWTIVAPTLAALALGRWLDRMFATRVFFSAPLLMLGAALGLWLAWRWMKAQQHGDRDD
ncbi:F0F1-ATPase subunit family protein [Burkholderia pseudomallei MSHR983]|uniref:AtpZ/AtpI family protein n=1 Tax=Burkholderia pseudomallei TaxID=28450 RepID=UPI000531610D|nr:AtpZ/AtpI family protein [Burkholderia pseudomallei]KGS72641.1 F0F1-ATPase subunit family protein [Burkholderia pseudomallei MSHR7334]KGU60498.1 F0F1-ATPase subunit family protein [Burkholderia pseudomallei MSHR983]